MFVEQLIDAMWMGFPILVLFFVRIFRDFEKWVPYTLVCVGLCFILAMFSYGLSFAEVLVLPAWSGLMYPSALILCWLIYGQLCSEIGRLGGIPLSAEAFVYGAFCGLWASMVCYREQPKSLSLAISGSLLGHIGCPLFLLFPNARLFLPFGLLMGVFFLRGHTQEDSIERNDWLWGIGIIVWGISWFSPFVALFIGCVLGFIKTNRIPNVSSVLPIWIFSVYASSALAGIGFLELLSRYMEGGLLGEQEGLLYDVLVGGTLLSLLVDPMTNALLVQGIWDRGLDVQHLPIMQSLFMSGIVGVSGFVFYGAGCVRTGWKELLQILAMTAVYVFIMEVWL